MPTNRSPAIELRETRPEEVTDAVMFASMGGVAIDAGTVRHDLSHVARAAGELVGAVVLSQGNDRQETVTVHTAATDDADHDNPAPSETPASEDADPNTSDEPTTPGAHDSNDAKDGSSPAVGCPAPETLARRLLDLTLMKLRWAGVRTTRLQGEPALLERLWAEAGWLDTLPAIASPSRGCGWRGSLAASRPDAAAVVEAAWGKAERALQSLRELAGEGQTVENKPVGIAATDVTEALPATSEDEAGETSPDA